MRDDSVQTALVVGMVVTALLPFLAFWRYWRPSLVHGVFGRWVVIPVLAFDLYLVVWGTIIMAVSIGLSWEAFGWVVVFTAALTPLLFLASWWNGLIYRAVLGWQGRTLRGDPQLTEKLKRSRLLRPYIEEILGRDRKTD